MLRNYEKFMTTSPTTRVERLRNAYLENFKHSQPSYTIYADRAIARVMKETEGEPMVLRRAKAFAAVVAEMPINIYPDELFVGWIAGTPESTAACPEQRGAKFELQLEYIEKIDEEDRRVLKEEIIPYWKGDGGWRKNWGTRAYQMMPPETRYILYGDADPDGEKAWMVSLSDPHGSPYIKLKKKHETLGRGLIDELMRNQHVGHCSFGYEKVLEKGFLGIKQDAENRLARLDMRNPEDLRKLPFIKAVIIAMEAAAGVGKRFADKAWEMARMEPDSVGKAVFQKIAEICDWVPAHPARTFHEALQSVWFTQIMNFWETPLVLAVSPGRADQYLYPYYSNDLKAGKITKEEAQELIDCWMMRFSQDATPYHSHSGAGYHLDVGGLNADGSDATNELSFMFLEGMMHTRLVEPNIGILVHSKTPDDLLIKACQLCSLGTGHPTFLNNDVFVENFLSRGNLGGPTVPLGLARTSGAIGCNENHVANYDSEYTLGAAIPLPAVLEMALWNGWSPMHNKQMTIKTGDPREFKRFEDLQEAFVKQLEYLAWHCAIIIDCFELAMAEMYPTVYQSALIEDCIEKGVPRESGGARYNFGPCIATSGAVDVGNSLAAIKKLVFDEKKIDMDQLLSALKNNFEGYENLRTQLLHAPKFGNDDDSVDSLVAWVTEVFCKETVKHKNTRGGHLMPYQNPLAAYFSHGKMIGALPSGRKAWEPLSDGISPTLGSDINGPTAVLKSVAKIDNPSVFFGETLNMRLNSEVFSDQEGISRLVSFIRTFIDLKIHHIQFNLVSSATLKAAQERPEDYQDLMVRVAGYVAYFVKLVKPLQDSIIARTEHGH
ncbi:glycyl radical protein [Desulfatitalea tepidiphila]|uniref:glycyl radical protein n=1 Tax=Desulfatitalea tepidiphila TaxID=1185843 RepID=UPI0006B455AA|nr:pyruvate formate lyase family protein [Desulfatitalea tepidiphila]